MVKEEPRCLACDQTLGIVAPLCRRCEIERAHTIHPRWLDLAYMSANQHEAEEAEKTPIINAAEARYEMRRRNRTERIA